MTICWTDRPRARTQLGRKTCVAAATVESTASHAAPAGSRRATASGRARTNTMPASGGGEDDAGQEDHHAGRDPGEETGQHHRPGDRSDAERAQQEPVAAGPQTQEPAGDEREQRPQGRARQDEQCRPEQEPADHPRVAYVAGAARSADPKRSGTSPETWPAGPHRRTTRARTPYAAVLMANT